MGVRIDELLQFLPNATREMELAVMEAGVTGKLTVGQVLDLLIGTAPATYDTLQEIAAWIDTHGDEYDALLVTLGNKLERDGSNALAGFLNNVNALDRTGSNVLAGFLNNVGALARDGSNFSAGFQSNAQVVGFNVGQTLTPNQKITAQKNIGALGASTSNKTASWSVSTDDIGTVFTVNTTAGNVVATLPSVASAGNGAKYTFKVTAVGTNTLTIDGNGAEVIDDQATLVLRMTNEAVTLICTGASWRIVNKTEVVERGSNSNGRYVRRSNGLLECYREFSLNAAVANTWVSAQLDWAYPFVTLESALIVLDSPVSNAMISAAINGQLTNFTAYLAASGDIPAQNVRVKGEGTWFN